MFNNQQCPETLNKIKQVLAAHPDWRSVKISRETKIPERKVRRYLGYLKSEGTVVKAEEPKQELSLEENVEIQQLKTRLKEREKELSKLALGQVTTEKLFAKLSEEMKALPPVKVNPYPVKPIDQDHEEDQILLFSDLHAGEIIRADETDGFNEYNTEIMCRRLQTLVDKVITIKDLHSHAFKVRKLWVYSLGDLVTGEIHSMAETNEFPIMTTIMQTALIISQMLLKLASRYEEVEYIGISGNHDRRHEKPRTKESYDNWSTILNWCISLLCKDQTNLKFIVPRSPFCIVSVRGYDWLLRHGHGKTASFAGIPYYGLSRKHSSLQEVYRKRGGFDYEVMGHYHQQAQLKDDKVFINGSIVGANEFAINELAAFSPPSQKLIGIDDKHGVTYTYRLMVDEGKTHEFVYDPDKLFEHKSLMRDFISTQFDSKRR